MPDYPEWVPVEIAIGYIEHGIESLLSWQLDVLHKPALRAPQYGNFIFSAPTSSGKTIVAELIAVNTVQELRCKAIFVFPYISVAREKFLTLQKIWRRVDLRVSAFIGSHSSPFQAWDAAICTIEKANSLINRMIDEKTIFDIGILVIDEFHMLFDGNRGPLVEQIVGKALYITRFLNHRIQIVGLSATLPNLDELADWLNAEKYETHFRPIQLKEMIMCDNQLRDVNTLQCIRTVSDEFSDPNDIDNSIIHSKMEAEKLALAISHHYDACFKLGNNKDLVSFLKIQTLKAVKQAFHQEVQFVDDILQKTIPYGIAFHHAGLTVEERESIENAFHEQLLHIVCATSTLSSGINLPAHRVIIKAQMCGPVALNGLTYMQMIGRAGRLGQTEKGESIVVCCASQLDLVQRLIQQEAIFARRCEVRRERIKLIIEAICSGLCKDENDLEILLSLMFFESKSTVKDELKFLIAQKLICRQKNFELCGTQLGRAVFTSSLSPDIALQVYHDLEKAMHSLALDNELHLLYLVTPLHNDFIWMNYIDWNVYYNLWSKLPSRLQAVGKMIGIRDSFILGKIQGRQASERGSMQIHLRFLSALALFDLIRECPLADVARRFRINRGTLQTLQQQSATYAYMVVTFCEKLGWTYLRSVLDGFSERLTFGIRSDLTELVQIDGIDGKRARAFHSANITTISTLAITSIDDIVKILRSVVPYVRRDNNEGLNRWLAGEGLMRDVEAAQILIRRARLHLSSSLRAIGIFSDEKIDSLFSTVTTICETNHRDSSMDIISGNSIQPDLETASHDFFTYESFEIKEEQSEVKRIENLTRKSKVIEKRPPKMTLLDSGKENLDILDGANDEMNSAINVEQLCTNFANTSMSDETLLRIGCSNQYDGKVEQITQPLNATTVLANNQKFDQINYEKQEEKFIDVKLSQPFDILNLIKNEIETVSSTISTTATTTTTLTATSTTASTAISANQQILDTVEKNEMKYLLSSKLIKSINELSSTSECMQSQQSSTLESIEEEGEIAVNSDESITNGSIHNRSNDLFDRTFCSSTDSPQSFDHKSLNSSSNCMKRLIVRRSSSSHQNQSSKSPSFQSPQHKMLKSGSPNVISMEKEIKFNESATNTATTTSEFQIMDVCRSRPVWEQFMTRQKHWGEIGVGFVTSCNVGIVGIALCASNDDCVYIDLREKYVSEVEIEERLATLYGILKSEQQEKYIYDLLSFSRLLHDLNDVDYSTLLFKRCFCLQTFSYLAHYRTLDGNFALTFQDLLSRLVSPERAVLLRNATQRLQAAICAFICLHMHNDLQIAAIRLSSKKSVELEMQAVILLSEIETIGVAFDVNEAKILISKLKKKLTEIETEAYGIAGIPFNFASAAEISQILFVRLQIPPPNITTSRHYSTNKVALQYLAPKYPIIALILQWRQINTALTTSLPALVKSCCSDGRIRANFMAYCCTGRVLTVHPNVQNVQKEAIIDGFSIRSLFIAPRGRMLVSADYRQLEMRMLAHLSADPHLIALFLSGGDLFEIMTNKWNSNNDSLHINVDRKKVKQLCYGIIYGMGAVSLAKELGVQKQHAQLMITSFFQQFPKVRTWMDDTLAGCRVNGYVSTMLSRRRFLPQKTGMLQAELAQIERQAINTCIQGSAAELFKMALLNLQKNLFGTNSSIVMQMHDEVLVETDESAVVTVAEIIKHSMISVLPNLRVPLAVKVSSGKNWGELQEYAGI